MFSYFGAKTKIIDLYPRPVYDSIVEPFAGSARYACKYGLNRDVHINDAWDVIYKIWKWIVAANRSDVVSLPELRRGESLKDVKQLSDVERWMLGFAVCHGAAQPHYVVTEWGEGEIRKLKRRLLSLVGKISHWNVTNVCYSHIEDHNATWFIDPPYQIQGNKYKRSANSIDFSHLGLWCKSRSGQSIVCESEGADWMDFVPLKTGMNRVRRKDSYSEVVWYRSDRTTGFGLADRTA